jgi:uncharacterized protein YukE
MASGYSANGFKVTPEFVRQAAVDCDTTASDVLVQLDNLRKYVTDLVGQADVANGAADAYQWMGITAQQFSVLMENVHNYSLAMQNALIDIGNGLRQNYVNYVNVEAEGNIGVQNIDNNMLTSLPPLNV